MDMKNEKGGSVDSIKWKGYNYEQIKRKKINKIDLSGRYFFNCVKILLFIYYHGLESYALVPQGKYILSTLMINLL